MLLDEVYPKALTSCIINGIFNFMLNTNGLNNVSGIYSITHIPTGKVYIGSAVNIAKRWYRHISQLRSNKHHSKHLQSAWNKYGEDAFDFFVVELVDDPKYLACLEQGFLDFYESYKSEYGYNICPVAGSLLGTVHSEETKYKISAVHLGVPKGPQTPEHTAKVSYAKAKDWIVTSPVGEEFKVHNLAEFCRDNNLHQSAMVPVARGKVRQHKGWKCRYAVHDD